MPYTYSWSSDPSAGTSFSDSTAADPTFTASSAGSYVLTLTVTDGEAQASDTALANINPTQTVIPSPPQNSIVIDELDDGFELFDTNAISATAASDAAYQGAEIYCPGENQATYVAYGRYFIVVDIDQSIELWQFSRGDTSSSNTAVPWTLTDAGGNEISTGTVDQLNAGDWQFLGAFRPDAGGVMTLEISNEGIDGFMRWDAIAYRLTTEPSSSLPIITEFTATAASSSQINITLKAEKPFVPNPVTDRVQIVNNTLVTPEGVLLRGAHGNWQNDIFENLSWWENMRDNFKLNAIRLDCRVILTGVSCNIGNVISIGQVTDAIGNCLDTAAQAGMFVIVDHHSCCCPGYDQDVNEYFWGTVAPLFKDYENAIYEAQNEPVNLGNYDATSLTFEEDMYAYIRARAPDTHIILMSSMYIKSTTEGYVDTIDPSIDWSNASVGLHPYQHVGNDPSFTYWDNVHTAYPTVITEFAPVNAGISTAAVWAQAEKTSGPGKTAWFYLDLRSGGNYGDGVLDEEEWLTEYWIT